MAITQAQMRGYVLKLHHTKKPITASEVAKLHGRKSGNLSGQEYQMIRDTKAQWNIK